MIRGYNLNIISKTCPKYAVRINGKTNLIKKGNINDLNNNITYNLDNIDLSEKALTAKVETIRESATHLMEQQKL